MWGPAEFAKRFTTREGFEALKGELSWDQGLWVSFSDNEVAPLVRTGQGSYRRDWTPSIGGA